jgi:hypothetical protein
VNGLKHQPGYNLPATTTESNNNKDGHSERTLQRVNQIDMDEHLDDKQDQEMVDFEPTEDHDELAGDLDFRPAPVPTQPQSHILCPTISRIANTTLI